MLKIELLVQLPNTNSPQRCVINILLDSALPVVLDALPSDPFILHFIMGVREFRTVEISIDFVDFLLAKRFCGVIEEWFQTLDTTPRFGVNQVLARNPYLVRVVTGQFGRIGAAAFLATYTWLNNGMINGLGSLVYATAIALLLWSIMVIASERLDTFVLNRVIRNIVPSVILLTDGDNKAFCKVKAGSNSPWLTVTSLVGAAVVNVTLNVVASALYAHLAGHS